MTTDTSITDKPADTSTNQALVNEYNAMLSDRVKQTDWRVRIGDNNVEEHLALPMAMQADLYQVLSHAEQAAFHHAQSASSDAQTVEYDWLKERIGHLMKCLSPDLYNALFACNEGGSHT